MQVKRLSQRLALSVIASQCRLSHRERHWHVGQLCADRWKLNMAQKIVPCYRGQQLRDNIPCQAVVNLCSKALPFSDSKLCSSRVGLTDTPVAPPLGVLASGARLRGLARSEGKSFLSGKGCVKQGLASLPTHYHQPFIIVTIAAYLFPSFWNVPAYSSAPFFL